MTKVLKTKTEVKFYKDSIIQFFILSISLIVFDTIFLLITDSFPLWIQCLTFISIISFGIYLGYSMIKTTKSIKALDSILESDSYDNNECKQNFQFNLLQEIIFSIDMLRDKPRAIQIFLLDSKNFDKDMVNDIKLNIRNYLNIKEVNKNENIK